jgi:transposase-like protein
MDTSTPVESKPPAVASNRRMWSAEERVTIVRASLKKGVTVNAVAKLYGVNPSQVYDWRKRARQAAQQAKTASLLPVRVADVVVPVDLEPQQAVGVLIEAQATRVTITGPVEASVLRTILECLVR